jgi:cation diffusion facilitator family transporter
VAGAERPHLLAGSPRVPERRYTAVVTVLVQVLFLNVAVAAAKIMYGYVSGAVSILSDGFHSLADSLSNVAALVGVHIARKPPDSDHPYGHRKFETLAAGLIAGFLMLVVVQIGQAALQRLRTGAAPEITPAAFVVMIGTLGVNLLVTRYERRKARELGSEVLLADAMHTRSDVFSSLTVIAALVGTALGYPLLDPIAALVVVLFIAHAGWEIAVATSKILADRAVIDADDLRSVVLSVPQVLGCHHIRTRGAADHVFLDLHIWMRPDMRLDVAHETSHQVKDLLMARYPQIADAIIHIEPPPRGAESALRNSEYGVRSEG